MKVSVMDLVFDAPRLLEWLGWSITKRPHLLGMHPGLPLLLHLPWPLSFQLSLLIAITIAVYLSSVGSS